jgi:hypothetical protein
MALKNSVPYAFPLWRSAARSIPLFNRELYDGDLGA